MYTIQRHGLLQTDDNDALETTIARMIDEKLGESMLQMEALIKSQNDRIQELEAQNRAEQDGTPAIRCESVYDKALLILVTSLSTYDTN